MAILVIEDGSQVSGATSYVTTAELETYAALRGLTISGISSELLIQAMDYIESLSFKGYKVSSTQALVWPRGDVLIDGYYIDSDAIPQLLKDAQIEVALAIDNSNSPLADVERQTKREKVGEIEVEYKDGSLSTTLVRKINAKLQKLLTASASGLSFKVGRA